NKWEAPLRRAPPVKYHYSYRFLTNPVRRGGEPRWALASGFQALPGAPATPGPTGGGDPLRGQWQVGSLT
ncbi:hypothetical protein PDJAM_G00275610, partial [Pangasius djambal]|nr:hypothetical protein [Pangasius djambal]